MNPFSGVKLQLFTNLDEKKAELKSSFARDFSDLSIQQANLEFGIYT